jgi:hypothetical protein
MADKVTIRETTEEDIDAILAIDKKIVGDDRAITYRDPIGFYLGGEFGMSFAAEADGMGI